MSLTATEPVTPSHPRPESPATDRLAAFGGLFFVSTIVIQNILRSSGPSFDAAPTKVTDYFVHPGPAVLIPLGLFPLGMVALFAFTAGVWHRAARAEASWWASMGALGVAAIAALFALVNITEIILAAKAEQLAGSADVIRALWAMHAAAFGLVLAAQATALVGLSTAAKAARLIPGRLHLPLLLGAAFLLIAAVFTTAIANGGPWIAVGLVGFFAWGVFILVASVSLGRARSARSQRR